MSISSCFNKIVLRRLYIYIYYIYNIWKCTFNSSCTHVFDRESQLGVHALKDKRRAKEKISYIRPNKEKIKLLF